MSETVLTQILSMLKGLEEENKQLRERITELETVPRAPFALSQIQSLSNIKDIRRTELSNDTKDTLERATDLVLRYARQNGFV
jgi:hypothetical protein